MVSASSSPSTSPRRPNARCSTSWADPNLSFLQFGYLSGKEGLLAGEKLYLDLKRMEMAYHDLNQREYELTKHVSVLQVNPKALLQLRMTGPVHGVSAGRVVRSRWSRPLFPAHQVGRGKHSVRDWTIRRVSTAR